MAGLHRAGAYTSALLCLASAASGQTAPPTTVRAEVQQATREYVKAINEFDLSAYTEMYSRQPGVTSVGDGQIIRGWDQIREDADKHLGSGMAGKFSLSIGAVDVTPLGPIHALALTKVSLAVNDPSGAQVRRSGAMTLIFQKGDGGWKLIHDHTSLEAEDAVQSSALGASVQSPANTATIQIVDGRAVEIPAASYVHYTFQVPAGTCVVTGRLVGISGGKKDFESLIMDDDNFQNWSSGQQATAIWQSGRVVVKSIENAVVSGPGTYHLVLSNLWSGVTAKTVQPQALAQCSQ